MYAKEAIYPIHIGLGQRKDVMTMATVVRGTLDDNVLAILAALDEYEKLHNGSSASLYRQNAGAIRVRVIDDRFAGMPRSRRHDEVWEFLQKKAGEDALAEVSVLILLPTAELRSSLANAEFDVPVASGP